MAFADDIIVIARSPLELKKMIAELESTLAKGGLKQDHKKTEWSHNLVVKFGDVEEAMKIYEATKADTLKEIADIKRDLSDSKKEVDKIRQRIASQVGDDSDHAWALNSLDRSEMAEAKEALQTKMQKMRATLDTLGEIKQNNPPPEMEIFVNGGPVQYIHSSRGMKILGSLVSGNGRTILDTNHRVAKAWAAF